MPPKPLWPLLGNNGAEQLFALFSRADSRRAWMGMGRALGKTTTTFHSGNVATHLKSSTSAIVYSSLFEPLPVLPYRPDPLPIGFACALSRGN